MTEQMYSDAEFEALLSNYDYSFQKGDLVKGIVCSYDSAGVIVDIGAKTAAYVPVKEAVVDKTVAIEETLKKDISKATKELPVWKKVTKTEIRETEFNKTTTNKIKR